MRSLRGKRALVTGAASGIGRAIALALAAEGMHLCLLDINQARLKRASNRIRRVGGQTLEIVCDLADSTAIDHSLDRALDEWPQFDLLVNNAGVAYRRGVAEMPAVEWNRLLAVNLHAPIHLCRRMLPLLLSRPEAHILNVGSVLGLRGFSKLAAYSTSKFGLVGFSQALRDEFAGSQLGVSLVCPGMVRTSMTRTLAGTGGRNRGVRWPRWLCTSPQAVARKSILAIRRNQAMAVVSPLAQLIWRTQRFAPWLFDLPRWRKAKRVSPPRAAATDDAALSCPASNR